MTTPQQQVEEAMRLARQMSAAEREMFSVQKGPDAVDAMFAAVDRYEKAVEALRAHLQSMAYRIECLEQLQPKDKDAQQSMVAPAGVPAGYALVPIEPTKEMEVAGESYLGSRAWKKMLAASPASTQPDQTTCPKCHVVAVGHTSRCSDPACAMPQGDNFGDFDKFIAQVKANDPVTYARAEQWARDLLAPAAVKESLTTEPTALEVQMGKSLGAFLAWLDDPGESAFDDRQLAEARNAYAAFTAAYPGREK